MLGAWSGWRAAAYWLGPPSRYVMPGEFAHHRLAIVSRSHRATPAEAAACERLAETLRQAGPVWKGPLSDGFADFVNAAPWRAADHLDAPFPAADLEGRRPQSSSQALHEPVRARQLPWRILKGQEGELTAVFGGEGGERRRLAGWLRLPVKAWSPPLPWSRIASNGAGVWLYAETGDDPSDDVRRQVLRQGGLSGVQFVPLESLIGRNGAGAVEHVAAFVSGNTVLLGQADPSVDPANAAILDRNAQRLRGLPTSFGPLRVVRVPLPPPLPNGLLRSYTSLVLYNRLAVAPAYRDSPELNAAFQRTLARVLPAWRLETLECDELAAVGRSPRDFVMLASYPPPEEP